MCIPVHSPWLPGYINVAQISLIILIMAGLFLDRPRVCVCVCVCIFFFLNLLFNLESLLYVGFSQHVVLGAFQGTTHWAQEHLFGYLQGLLVIQQ